MDLAWWQGGQFTEAPTDINVTMNNSFMLAADRTYQRDQTP